MCYEPLTYEHPPDTLYPSPYPRMSPNQPEEKPPSLGSTLPPARTIRLAFYLYYLE